MRRLFALALLVVVVPGLRAADIAPLIAQIKSVGAEGAGSAPAAAAWAQLSKLNADAILPIMGAFDDASPRAANWLRSALDAIVERERAAKRALPVPDLEKFLADKRHNGQARRLAYELILAGDPRVEKRMLPTFLDDPSLELRFEAVAKAFEAAKALPKESDEAKATMRKLVQASRDVDQVEEIAKELDGRGEPIDFIKLYGFITQWHLCGTFDNTGGKGFAASYPPEKKVELSATVPGKGGKEVKWFGHVTPDKMGAVDLNKAIAKEKNCVAYGFTVIDSPEDRAVEIRAASATALKIFVNGQETFAREVYHQTFATDSHIAPARLKKGKNTILIKVCQNDQKEPWAQEWRFQLRVSDALGTPVPLTVEPVESKGRCRIMKKTILALLGLVLVLPALAGDWPQFRGPGGRGVSTETGLPETWGANDNLKWKVALPGRGLSCPVIAGNRLFLTANSGMAMTRLHVLGFDADTGAQLWERQFWATGQTLCHPKTCMAGPTPVTDGKHVWCLFATNDLACLTAAGDVVWYRSLSSDYPLMANHVGRAASPVLFQDLLIVPMENQGASYLIAIDAKTGANRWKIDRPLENNWTTPIIAQRNGRTELILQGMRLLSGFDPNSGEKLWEVEDDGLFTIPSPVVAGDLVLAASRGMIAVKPGANGAAPVAWKTLKLGASTPSPVVLDGRVYTLKGDVLVCGDVNDGKMLWDLRLKGPFSASPVVADGKLYLVNEEGLATVVQPGPTAKVLASNELKDTILATPSIANGSIYLRSDKFLYRIAQSKKSS